VDAEVVLDLISTLVIAFYDTEKAHRFVFPSLELVTRECLCHAARIGALFSRTSLLKTRTAWHKRIVKADTFQNVQCNRDGRD
jgi:hypothetical protein